jgi:hypothetical protein
MQAGEAWQHEDAGAEKLYVQFAMHPVKNEAKSLEEGRPIFEDQEYVKLMAPGDKSNVIHRPVRADDKHRFSKQYADWKAGAAQTASGTPLSEWPAVTRSQVEELAYFKVLTVEHLAEMSDGIAQNLGPIQALKQKAKAWIEAAKGNAPSEKLRAELATRDNEIETLKRQLKEQGDAIAELRKGNHNQKR